MRPDRLRIAALLFAGLAASGCAAETEEDAGSNDAAMSLTKEEALGKLSAALQGSTVSFGEQLRFASADIQLGAFSDSTESPVCKVHLQQGTATVAQPRIIPQGDSYTVWAVSSLSDLTFRTWTLGLKDKKVTKAGPVDFVLVCRAKDQAMPTATMFEQALSLRGVKFELAKGSARP